MRAGIASSVTGKAREAAGVEGAREPVRASVGRRARAQLVLGLGACWLSWWFRSGAGGV